MFVKFLDRWVFIQEAAVTCYQFERFVSLPFGAGPDGGQPRLSVFQVARRRVWFRLGVWAPAKCVWVLCWRLWWWTSDHYERLVPLNSMVKTMILD